MLENGFASGITFRDLCGKPNGPTLARCFLKPKHESAPRKVIPLANLESEPRCAFEVVFCLEIVLCAS
jgi:hypothetical protein